MTKRLVGQAIGSMKARSGVDSLSDRELEVFQLIGQGLATGEVARQLNLSVHTVDTYREKIRAKLNLKSGAELVQRAVRWVLENT
jgi:DNA-binding CsgD family transcriptional regulator